MIPRRLLSILLLAAGLGGAAPAPALAQAGDEAGAAAEGAGAGEAASEEEKVAAEAAAKAAEREAARQLALKKEEEERRKRLPPELVKMIERVELFEREAADFRREVQLLIERKYHQRREQLSKSYEKAIADLEVLERKDRLDAIALFEEFLARYPDEPKYSPDAMMRLAELYYEKIEDEFRITEKEYYAEIERRQATGEELTELPPLPEKSFAQPIALYQRLITQFPDYRYGDAAYYLLGYLLGEQEEHEEALATFDRLVRKYPSSRFVPEVWMRIGEFFFDADQGVYPDALSRAIAAYTNALPFRDHPLYDKVLYKLGWTYYRIDDYDSSVRAFADLLAFYDEKAAEAGEEVGGDLRAEAIQYTAISFADESWGSPEKARAFFEQRGHPPYEFDVIRRLGDVYFDLTKHQQAVATYEFLLARYPTAEEAPVIQEKIIAAHERDRAFAKAFAAQEALVNNYAEGSAWWEANKGNPEALAHAADLTEKSLRAGAVFHHEQAQKFREEEKIELAFTEYKLAADAYGRYLQLYPHTKDLYEFQYYYADSLYNSAQFVEAAKYFELTRDSNYDAEYLEDSALGAVLAYEKEIERQQQAGLLPVRQVLTSKDWPEGQPVVEEPIPELWQQYIAAGDAMIKRMPEAESAPNVAYKSAEVLYIHGHHAEARRRFEYMVKRWPGEESAQYAANLIIESFLIAKDWRGVEETSARLLETEAIAKAGGEVQETFTQFKLGGRFKRAQQLFDDGSYEEAATLYLQLVKEAPKHEFADRALYNAAVCYEKVLRFESALGLYERVFREYPSSELADKALFLVAYNAERAYDFDKAIKEYMDLIENYPQSQQRQPALQNASLLLYLTQKYERAAAQFRRFARLFPDAAETPRLLLLAAECQEKAGNPKGAISAYEEFIRRFRRSPEAAAEVVEAKLKVAKAFLLLNQYSQAQEAYHQTVALHASLAPTLSGDEVALARASEFAAEAQFMIAEKEFRAYDDIKIVAKGRGKKLQNELKAALEKKKEKSREVSALYRKVYDYKRLDWTLAAAYRIGFVLERFAGALYDAPIPTEIKRLGEEYVWAYQDQLAQVATPIEEEAQKAYVTAMEKARDAGIINRWTKLTLESLNRYRPDEFPILKEARDHYATTPMAAMPVAPSIEGIPPPVPMGTRLGGLGDEEEDEK
ncbi:MAG: tetratricopeptide repeat protein [Deltaproteobacteria bacterium]|nr:tetratricopeptide repeat protein [Deltaproteobacteria bacterium]